MEVNCSAVGNKEHSNNSDPYSLIEQIENSHKTKTLNNRTK